MHCDFYNLPDITIIGGDTFPICFDLFRDSRHSIPFEMGENFVAYFSLVEFINREYTSPLYSFSSIDPSPRVFITNDADGKINNVEVKFKAADTASLYGKYIYQITLKDNNLNKIEVIGQGTMTIVRNIDPNLILN